MAHTISLSSALAAARSCSDVSLLSPSPRRRAHLLHFAGIEPAPSAKPETISTTFTLLFFCDNLFVREWWFDKPQER